MDNFKHDMIITYCKIRVMEVITQHYLNYLSDYKIIKTQIDNCQRQAKFFCPIYLKKHEAVLMHSWTVVDFYKFATCFALIVLTGQPVFIPFGLCVQTVNLLC